MPVNSHYLPQLLLKGFSFRHRGDESYVHVYRKGCLPFSSNTKGVGAEGDFYGKGNIEQTLSEAETEFAALARHLREGHCESSTKPLIDKFVAHSLIRTQAFRAGVHEIGTIVLREVFQEFLDPEYTPQLLTKLVEDAMREPDVRNLLATVPADTRPLIEGTMRKMLLHPDMHQKLRQMILPTLDTIDTAVSVQSAQRQALENHQNLENRICDLRGIVWRIETYEAHSLILGDIGPLVRGDGGRQWGQIFHGIPQMIWFPLSDQVLLVGETTISTRRPDCEEANIASAENSIEFFIASRRTLKEDEYQQRIGAGKDRITSEQLSELKKTIREYLTTPGVAFTPE